MDAPARLLRVGAATQESSTDITGQLIGSCQSLRAFGKTGLPVPRALPGHLHKTLCPCQFLTDPSSSWKNRSHQTRGGRLTHARCPERWTLTQNGSLQQEGCRLDTSEQVQNCHNLQGPEPDNCDDSASLFHLCPSFANSPSPQTSGFSFI